MKNRALILMISFVVALIALGGILLIDTPRGSSSAGGATQPGGIVATSDLPGFNPGSTASDGPRDIKAGEVERYTFEQINSHGQLVQFFGDRLIPKPAGVVDVEMPVCRIHLIAEQRILQVRADSGTFLAPEDEPKSGELIGNVVVQLFDSGGSEPVSTAADSPHLELQVTLPRARFDLDLGQLTSADAVVVSGPRLRFEGTGLQLSYNALRNRIDRLVIEKGKRLWFRHARNVDAEPRHADAGPRTGEAAGTPGAEADRPLVYHATFEKNVRVTSPEAVIDADQLDVLFSLGSTGDEKVSLSQAKPNRNMLHMPALALRMAQLSPGLSFASLMQQQVAPIVQHVARGVLAQAAAPLDDMLPSADAVVITWEGRMIVVPQLDPPADLAANDELIVTLTGAPLKVTTGDNDVITGGRLTYAGNLNIMTIDAVDDATPLTITSPQLGILTGTQLILDQNQSHGKLLGPGKLISTKAPAAGGTSRGLADMTLTFAKQVDLDLIAGHADADPDAAAANAKAGMNLTGIRSARFIGDVAVAHPRFDMTSNTLDVELDNTTRPATVKQITAHGRAKAVAHATDTEPESTIAGQSIILTLQPTAEGDVEPTKLTAAGGVVARQADRVLLTGHLEADLATGKQTDGDEPALLIKQVRGTQGVEARIEDQDIVVHATTLVADPSSNRINLYGTDEKLARIERPDGNLLGKHLVLLADSETILVPGPGIAEFYPEPDAGEAPAPAGSDEGLRINWSESMTFNNTENYAEFVGKISAQAKDKSQRTTLTSNELRLDFVPQREAVALKKADPQDRAKIARSIRTITAKTDVSFMSEAFEDKLDGKLQTRLSVKGPLVTFDGPTEQVHVLGKGTMLIEDYRPEKPTDPNAAAAGNAGNAGNEGFAKFSGRGTTLFSWVKSLMLDAMNNDMKIEGDVAMAHRPAGEQKLSKLYADTFIADLEETGGLGVWMSSEAPKPRLNGAFADGDGRRRVVVQLSERTIETDELEYKAAEQTLALRGENGNMTIITRDDDPKAPPMSAEKIDYFLETGRVEIGGMGAISAPAR